MKKIVSLGLVFVLIAALFSACGQKQEAAVENKQETKEAETKKESKKEEQKDLVKETLSAMTLEEKVEQMIMPAYRYWGEGEDAPGVTELNDQMRESIKKHALGGIILFAQNIETAEQTSTLIGDMVETTLSGGAKAKPFISVDQEGGQVSRMTTGTMMPGNMAIGAAGDSKLATKAASAMGEELSALGFNVDFAPVLDVNNNPANPVIGIRSFSDDADKVAEFGEAFIKGLHEQNIITTTKHFPGHGDTAVDSHTGLPSIDKSLDELKKNELIPFIKNAKNTDMIMTAHIQYPQIEKETYVSKVDGKEITLPATLSKTILTDILRKECGFDGVIVTDSMKMDAIAEHFDRKDAARLAINAGVDMLLMPVDLSTEKGLADFDTYISDIVAMVESGEIEEARIDDATGHILKVKEKYGLLDMDKKEETADLSVIGSKEHHDTEKAIAQKAVTLLKNENDAFPVSSDKKAVVFVPLASEVNSVAFAIDNLKADGTLPKDYSVETLCYEEKGKVDPAKAVSGADTVVCVSATYSADALDPKTENGADTVFIDKLIAATHKNEAQFILVSAQLPYDAARFTDADAIVCCYLAKGMEELPDDYSKESKQYGPNIPAAIGAVFGGFTPTGSLPVNIPALDDKYQFTDEILYKRGE